MRQLIVQVPVGHGKNVLEIAKSHNGVNLAQLEGTGIESAIDLVLIHVSNGQVEKLLTELEDIPNVHISMFPTGIMALQPPPSEAPQQVTNVEERSPIEIFLSGLQSVGSWKGFLGYAVMAGFVVWTGLYTNTAYLLTAAMLIAPFAGPAMNVAIATARGDRYLLKRSILRYFSALGVTILTTLLLSLIFGQEIATSTMIDTSTVSSVAILLPLAAGAAGGLNLVQSDRSSLVSGAATGMLVAASLAPPAGTVGMAIAINRWDLVINVVFVLLLQLFGINLTAAIVFRLYGLKPKGARYDRGKGWLFPLGLTFTVAALACLLSWQFAGTPNLQRPTIAQRANSQIEEVVKQYPEAKLVEANVRFTRAGIENQNTLLCTVYVQKSKSAITPSQEIGDHLTQAIQTSLLKQNSNLTPLVDVSVLEQPR